MKILVTGGAGYVGSVVAGTLLAAGHRVTVFDSLMYGGDALPGLYPFDGFSFVRGDIRDAAALRPAMTGCDAVVHLAAIVGDPACSRQPDLARAVNLDASLQAFGVAQELGVGRFVFASTCSNYGKMEDPTQPLTERSALAPVSLYAETKVAVEQALLAAAAGPTTVTLLRLATVFGISPRMRFDLTVNEFTMELMVARKLKVFGGQFWRPYLHVRDAARMVALVLESPAAAMDRQVFNVGDSSQNFQKQQLVELIRAEVGPDVTIDYVHRDEDPRDYRVAFDKVAGVGFRISRTVPDGIREVMHAISSGVITDFANPKYRD